MRLPNSLCSPCTLWFIIPCTLKMKQNLRNPKNYIGTIARDPTGQLRVHITQAMHVRLSITAAPLVTEIASFAVFTSKSSAFANFVFVGQTVTHIPHPLQFWDCTSFLSFAMMFDTASDYMNISLNTGVQGPQVFVLSPCFVRLPFLSSLFLS